MTAVVAGSVVSDQEAVDELRVAWAEVSRSYARCWAAMAEVASRTTIDWETAEAAAALTFTTRRADYELSCAQTLLDRLPRVYAALTSGDLDHHKALVFTSYLHDVTPAQAERISARLVPRAPGWTTGQLAARLLREVQAIDPDYTRRGTAGEAGRGAARRRVPATINQTRADLLSWWPYASDGEAWMTYHRGCRALGLTLRRRGSVQGVNQADVLERAGYMRVDYITTRPLSQQGAATP